MLGKTGPENLQTMADGRESGFITGVSAAAGGAALARLLRAGTPLTVVVGSNLSRAELLAEDSVFFRKFFCEKGTKPQASGIKQENQKGKDAWRLMPDTWSPCVHGLPRISEEEGGAAGFENACDLLTVLSALRRAGTENPMILASTPDALFCAVPEPEAMSSRELELARGMRISLREVAETLAKDFDYDNEALCESPGQFSVRGGLIDVYPLNASAPVRIDFFGDEIEALREFDPETQRSLRKLEKIVVAAGTATDDASAPQREGALFDYFPTGTEIVFAEPESLENIGDLLAVAKQKSWRVRGFSSLDEEPENLRGNAELGVPVAWQCADLEEIAYGEISSAIGSERLAEAEEIRRRVLVQLDAWSRKGERVVIVAESEGSEERLREILDEERQAGTLKKSFSPEIVRGNIGAGFRIIVGESSRVSGEAAGALVVATERELFGRNRRRVSRVRSRRLPHKSRVEQLLDFNELVDGDMLVHLQH
ncbi:MAG: hypothetical protein IJX22_05530, partial [Opitutales bacterium]|nr:hypothetical protein [Opitutales bacterium]